MENQGWVRVARGPGTPRGKNRPGRCPRSGPGTGGWDMWALRLCGQQRFPRPTPPLPVDVSGQSREGVAALRAPCPACWRTAGPPPVRAWAAVNGDDPCLRDAAAAVGRRSDRPGRQLSPGRARSRRRDDARQPLPVPVTLTGTLGRGNPGGGGALRPGGPDHPGGHRHRARRHKGVTGRTIDVAASPMPWLGGWAI